MSKERGQKDRVIMREGYRQRQRERGEGVKGTRVHEYQLLLSCGRDSPPLEKFT